MIGTIIRAVEDASIDDRTRVIVLRANGSDFCSGIDLVQANRRKAPALMGTAHHRGPARATCSGGSWSAPTA